jgi:hypothetical protein
MFAALARIIGFSGRGTENERNLHDRWHTDSTKPSGMVTMLVWRLAVSRLCEVRLKDDSE